MIDLAHLGNIWLYDRWLMWLIMRRYRGGSYRAIGKELKISSLVILEICRELGIDYKAEK